MTLLYKDLEGIEVEGISKGHLGGYVDDINRALGNSRAPLEAGFSDIMGAISEDTGGFALYPERRRMARRLVHTLAKAGRL